MTEAEKKRLQEQADARASQMLREQSAGGNIGSFGSEVPRGFVMPQAPTIKQSDVPADKPGLTLDDVSGQLMKAQMEAQQKENAELRRHGRTQQMIGGITDAANALASMYNATRGAAPTYDPRASLDGKALQRYDRAKAELDKDHAQQMAYIRQLRADAMAGENAKTARERLQYMRDREERLAQEAQNKTAYQQEVLRLRREKQELDAQLADRKIDIDEYKAKTGRLNAELRRQAALYGLRNQDGSSNTSGGGKKAYSNGNNTGGKKAY